MNALAPIAPDHLAKVLALEEKLREFEIPVVTEHVLHAGMYARTVRLEAGTVIVGVMIRIPTILILEGHCWMFAGEWHEVQDYQVIPALAGRKQVLYAVEETNLTMLFPTTAKTVEEAEEEFTGEAHKLLSRRNPCLA